MVGLEERSDHQSHYFSMVRQQDTPSISATFCDNLWGKFWDIPAEKGKSWPAGGARWKVRASLESLGCVYQLWWQTYISFVVLFFRPVIPTGRRPRERSTESNCTHLRDRWASRHSSYLLLSLHLTLLRHSLTFSSDRHFIINPLHFTLNLVWYSSSLTMYPDTLYVYLLTSLMPLHEHWQRHGFWIMYKSSLSKWQQIGGEHFLSHEF